MAKTCRRCAALALRCDVTEEDVRRIRRTECQDWSKRETPLLEDELVKVLGAMLNALTGHWFSYTKLPGRIEDAEKEAQKLIEQAYVALARHWEEVRDDPA